MWTETLDTLFRHMVTNILSQSQVTFEDNKAISSPVLIKTPDVLSRHH